MRKKNKNFQLSPTLGTWRDQGHPKIQCSVSSIANVWRRSDQVSKNRVEAGASKPRIQTPSKWDMIVEAKQYRPPQIKWEIPSKFVLASDWYVVSGEDSEEKAVQKLRESTVLEALYHHSSTIPHNPFFPPDIANQYYDDRLTPLIPIIPIEEAEADASLAAVAAVTANQYYDDCQTPLIPIIPIEEAEADASLAAVAAVTAIMKSMDPKSLIDTDLLINIPSFSTPTTKLINKYRLATDNISIPSESNMPENAQLFLSKMSAGDTLSLPVSKPSMFLTLKEDHGRHDHTGNAHVAARTDPLMKKTIRADELPDNLQRNNNPAAESLQAPVHITKDYNAKTAVPMLKDHEQPPHRNIQRNLQKPEFSNKRHQKTCKFIKKPEGCKKGSECLFRHETYNQQRPNKRMKLGSVDNPAADESSLHSSYHISTDASCKINKPSGLGVAVKDVDSPAADESSFHSSYHISTDASSKINKPSGLGVAAKDDGPAADESSLHSSYHISTDALCKINKPSGLGVAVKDVDCPAADESSLHSSYHISTDASCEINKPSSSGVAVKDDSPAADESSLHSSYHISTDALCKINKPSGWRMSVQDDDSPAADDSSYHISTDASWKINKPSGLGVSIKDGNGHLLEAWCDSKRDLPSSLVAEGFALRWALSESLQRNWDNIHIFSDCKTLVDCINGATRCPSSCRVVYDDIILLKSNFRSCVFSFVPRSYNVHAHKLAQIGISLTKKLCVKVLSLDDVSSQ